MPSYVPMDAVDMNYASVVTVAVLVFSLAWYYCPKYGGVHWFTGPRSNIDEDESSCSPASHPAGTTGDGSKKFDDSGYAEPRSFLGEQGVKVAGQTIQVTELR